MAASTPDPPREPALSVLLATPDGYATIRETIRHLRAQTVRDRLEIVILAPSRRRLNPDQEDLRDFARCCVVEVGPFRSVAAARAEGVRRAGAPIVAFAEDHAYPAPGWAEALLAAHRGPWAAVGPVIINANPESPLSRIDQFLSYGPFEEPALSGVVDEVPGDNSSYKRALLLAYGPQLEAMLEAEPVLHRDLRARGHQLYLEAAARTHHRNFSRLSAWLSLRFQGGRVYGADRARKNRWSPLRRLLYVAGAPLIPLVQIRPILRGIRRSGRRRDLLPGALTPLLLGLAAGALGEAAGYAFGAGGSPEKLTRLKFHREQG